MPLPGTFLTVISDQQSGDRRQEAALFSPSPYTPHPTPHTLHPAPHSPITPHPQNSLIFPTFGLFTP
ncbi:MAG: hypothetical protein GPI90_10460 [Microcystis aeruginosa K13-05]|uniref:hypothetical protein n=1 Tax=unclassified Microcystis TaxID=2643300 RepID=UPI0022C479B8|nr:MULTISPECIES: hypothetical protein [unclassified Microcystis]MCE2664288.1 hypothetical protein [Microcystis sp. 53602_E8]MCZ8362062.1 hypothetical protein [Microcystis sp. LE19-251.1A]MDJ0538454.1 hypothetical protein [Microcystis sp. M53603_WE2]MDJ0567197.1 hypothetical protein [Microcystis sp. M49629_WE12]NCR80475.1 hypothetical protein [Microcystis aeruginosa K13-10]NCR85045.1 hypothetical protein [Microcystis aeruginosa K13-05]